MDIVRLLEDFNVFYATEGERHTREGWVNMKCPFCTGTEGLHLGFNLEESYFTCYRCGWHPPVQTISHLIGVSLPDTARIIQKYGIVQTKLKKPEKRAEMPFLLPTGLTGLTTQHKTYLRNRGFDPDALEQKWGLQSTGPVSHVGKIPYKHRIFIPYYWNGELVTFDARDVTGKAENKYQACPVDREIMERKKILYGNQEAWTDGIGIGVEGPADVWRFGDFACATSGINFKQEQVRLISRIFRTFFIVYDSEIQAQQQARKLKSELRFRGVKAEVVSLKTGDPGEMQQRKADEFVKSILH